MVDEYYKNAVPQHWDIFCRVVDNIGDIGVCWRLARRLAMVHGVSVRLWVDDAIALRKLCPPLTPMGETSHHDGVEVRMWRDPFALHVEVADVVIEAFACELPPAYTKVMAACVPAPVWINLEYLSAEAWVADCHLMCSPHPRLGLNKYFYFPGFTPETGGLLREPDLFSRREQFLADNMARSSFLALYAGESLPQQTLVFSLFAYAQPQMPALLDVWSSGEHDIVVLVPEGLVLTDVSRFFGPQLSRPGSRARIGRVTAVVLPFLSQLDYDLLLWCCDLNFVRGEDSFVRAQWAAVPFVWHIYQQTDDAHRVKLDAFLDRFERGLNPAVAAACRKFWLAWNGVGLAATQWPAMVAALPALATHGRVWADQLASAEDLTSKLIKFCADTVK